MVIGLRSLGAAITLGFVVFVPPAGAAADSDDDAYWTDLKASVFGDRVIRDGAGVIALEAPYRAHDAAIVPISIIAGFEQTQARYISKITLVIDRNPAPVAAVFHLTPESGLATISTRVRINEYTYMHAVAETSDGELYGAEKYVKAAGGCSAPAQKDQDAALARLGKMKLRRSTALVPGEPNQAQILISHPNNSGLQMDQLTRHYIPPRYIRNITVSYAGRTVLTVEGDISLSEDPSIHFNFVPEGPGEMTVEAVDTDGEVFTRSWPVTAPTG